MLLVSVSVEAQINGLFSVIAFILVLILSGIVLSKAIKYKEKNLYYFFICVIFALSPWYPGIFGYIYWVFTNQLISYELYVVMQLFFVPIGLMAWLNIYTNVLLTEKKAMFLIIYGIISLIFISLFIYYLFLAPNAPVEELLVTVDLKNFDSIFVGFALLFSIISSFTVLGTGIHFSLSAIQKANDELLKWKGRFLLIGFICFTIDATFDAIIINQIIIIPLRILLLIAYFFWYAGFIMPDFLKKIILKD